MAGLCEGSNEPLGSLKANFSLKFTVCRTQAFQKQFTALRTQAFQMRFPAIRTQAFQMQLPARRTQPSRCGSLHVEPSPPDAVTCASNPALQMRFLARRTQIHLACCCPRLDG
ncbi:hypothetical protein ANN_18653 [Periplaneta americana]|uniref:Uncharacterized protein n=1 Tax=Periplaneta americana TaxID=6978 RepID=A0ABQ8SQU3_PERAM|nr:hypothetical protein ANN_18653 [Periplaneta americana]